MAATKEEVLAKFSALLDKAEVFEKDNPGFYDHMAKEIDSSMAEMEAALAESESDAEIVPPLFEALK